MGFAQNYLVIKKSKNMKKETHKDLKIELSGGNDKDTEKLQKLMRQAAIAKSGWGGIDRNGNIVDRRVVADAVPIQENKLMDTPAPKNLEDAKQVSMEELKKRGWKHGLK